MRMCFTMSKPTTATKTKTVLPHVPRSMPNRFGLNYAQTTKKTSCGCGK